MSATQIIQSMSNGEQAPLPRLYADHAMPQIIIAGTDRRLAWSAARPLPAAAHA
jgi:hypothetical protein